MTKQSKIVFLCAGGTGGHIFPALSLASDLQQQGWRPIIITDQRYKNYAIDQKNIELQFIASSSMAGNIIGKITGLAQNLLGIVQALWLISKHKPVVVVGFGGYPSFPTMIAAIVTRIKTIIYEPNAVLGKANRYLASYVNIIATPYPEAMSVTKVTSPKMRKCASIVRGEIIAVGKQPFVLGQQLNILVTGGSQAASIFSHIVPAALALLTSEDKMRINIVQQCRAEDLEEVRRIYEEGGIRAELSLFFTDMDIRLATAHLVIARAGAGSIAEIQAAARSAILVPYPGSYLDHQLYNGLSAEKAGFAWCVVQELFTATWLQEKIMGFLENPEVLKNTACNAKESAAFSYQTLLGIVMSCR